MAVSAISHFKGEDNVNKADLIEKIAKDAGVTKTQADAAINSILSGIEGELKKSGRVTLVGFGTFSVGTRSARTGRNPQTGKPIKIPAKKVAKFSPGAELKAAVNKKK
jgi:DNA-binding protein HU-beta